jgi:large subunit ribosomal protein L13
LKTYTPGAKDIVHEWHIIDASGKILGRLATQVSCLLMGKHKSIYAPHIDTGDYVIVVNAAKIKVSGKKMVQKMYYRHSGYPGGLKEQTFENVFEHNHARVIEKAVKGMLPHNSLGATMFRKLRVYPDNIHPHHAQVGKRESDS